MPKPDKGFAALGGFTHVPIAPYQKRIDKLLKKIDKSLGDALEPEIEGAPTLAWLHARGVEGTDIAIKNRLPEVYVIEGDLTSKHSLAFDSQAATIVLVGGSVATTYLRCTFGTLLLVEGGLAADYIVYDSYGLVIAGKTATQKIFIYGDYDAPQIGKQPKGVVHTCYEHEIIKDVEPHVLWKRMITGKRFLWEH